MVVLCLSCGSLPEIKPAVPVEKDAILKQCEIPFVKSKWRFVHSIEAEMPTGDTAFMMGITIADPSSRSLHSVIMSIEGLVLFNAAYSIKSKKLEIKRGIQPFDSANFALGMMKDISLIFFYPDAPIVKSGTFPEGFRGCRFQRADNSFVDITVPQSGEWEVHQYNESFSLTRSIKASSFRMIHKKKIPGTIDLQAPGLLGYSLHMELVEAEVLD
ncbi:MAG: hypothetical protein GY754_30410 [bacterium]|nr:hypothetical protein [bacterium]